MRYKVQMAWAIWSKELNGFVATDRSTMLFLTRSAARKWLAGLDSCAVWMHHTSIVHVRLVIEEVKP